MLCAMRSDLPLGTVTFLFTDVEGSTKLLRELGAERYAQALDEHRRVVRAAARAHEGVEVDTQGDAFFLAFPTAAGALAAGASITEELEHGPIQVRIGIHEGTPLVTHEGYVGDDVNVAARIAAAGSGGQVLVSARAAAAAAAASSSLRDLGEHRLKDVDGTVSILQLGDGTFPPLTTISNTNLPRPVSSFVGRERELTEVLAHIRGGARLLTLTGPGGAGKTRLALEAAATLVPEYRGGVFWVGLASVRDPSLVPDAIARSLGARNGLVGHIGERELLVVVDNFEQVVEAARELSALLAACSRLHLVVTTRELLRVQGEVEFAVPPLAEPEALDLFCARAQREPSDAIRELCVRLDSLPLAIELAAARARAVSPPQLLERLGQRLDLLRGGRDADPRQQTLRATIEWSYDLLAPAEQLLFGRLSVFAGGCTLEAAEEVAEADVDTLQSLVEKSLIRFANERYSMLETVRAFAEERLDQADAERLRRRLRAYVLRLAEASAEGLHTASESAVSAGLAPEFANIRAAVSDALEAGEPDDAGRIVGALYPFLISHGPVREAYRWSEAALADRERLSSRGLAEALAGGGELARFAGELDRAIELKEELASFDGELQRPNWRAATLADLCEVAIEQEDFALARSYAQRSAEAGGGARASLCFAELALRAGELDAAERHSRSAIAGFAPGAFNYACALEIAGETARRAGEPTRAAESFRDALRAFADIGDAGGIADCLQGLARIAAAGGDTARAGRLDGAALGLRESHGRRPIRTDLPDLDLPAVARDEGRSFTVDDAVEYGLRAV
jgi:predicted ATPase/class 3 adenylate cyclase